MGELVATGPGPRWLRTGLAGCAALYFAALIHHPPQIGGLHAIGFFTESTCLFPSAASYVIEFRLEAWSCTTKKWEPLDPRAYFPIEADDKESRFQRLGHFYQTNTPTMQALEDWIVVRHPEMPGDGVEGPIGGIKLFKWTHPIPPPGSDVEHYVYRPRDPVPHDERKDLWWPKTADRRRRCSVAE